MKSNNLYSQVLSNNIKKPLIKSEGPEFNLIECRGDLFVDASQNSSLAHCVSADFRMGKGIASVFKEKFQGVEELLSQKKGVGEVAFLRRNDRYIFYIITKEKYFQKPTRRNFENSLYYLKELCEELGVKVLSAPKIGTGLDKLPPEFVRKTILKVFDGCDLNMTIFYL
ncbi:5388_t:CDS:1 [Diversispora eburnea]|uniref:ADP-ribose 1''-phosphate phosphatase n=1 Tax=Diversispora eburnea TaxID=1213867 RepID=A0A9N8VCW1_9GLOM|nr:5388_t:CDS:1 [Diversispora eburnea]